MASWEWIALGLAFLALLQLVALQYARKMGREEEAAGSPAQAPAGPPLEASGDRSRREPAGDEIVCTHCGAPNDPTFTYCRRCVSQLA